MVAWSNPAIGLGLAVITVLAVVLSYFLMRGRRTAIAFLVALCGPCALLLPSFTLLGFLSGPNAKSEERAEYWKKMIDKDLPPGTSEENINNWGSAHGIEIMHRGGGSLYAIVEVIQPEVPFPCSERKIYVDIPMNEKQESVENKVDTFCVS